MDDPFFVWSWTSRVSSSFTVWFAILMANPEDMIDASPKTTVAALNGPALGGGAEVSLACSVLKGWKLLRERVRESFVFPWKVVF